jgi:tetratricopeptide (TPR) repeat protein
MRSRVDYTKWSTKWKDVQDDSDLAISGPAIEAEAAAMMKACYASEVAQEEQEDRLKELKLKLAVEAYEKRRPADRIMNHYWIKEAGDPEAVGEYLPTGDYRCDAPVYRNQHGLILSRERQPMGPNSDQESFGWVIGHMAERRPLYGVQSEDLSVPTLGWQVFTAPEPVPIIRYYTDVATVRIYKEKGNTAFQKKEWAAAEDWYSKALACNLDTTEYAETLGLLFSNRAEARLRMMNFGGAAGDADNAMLYLRTVAFEDESTAVLKQKTLVRGVKARQALKLLPEAAKLLREEKRNFPSNPDIERLMEEVQLALGPPGTASSAGASREMLGFVSSTMDAMTEEAYGLGGRSSEPSFPESLAMKFKKLEYMLGQAKGVKGDCFADLQRAVRTSGGLVLIQWLTREQWKSNLAGKTADSFKLPAAASLGSLAGLACEGFPEGLKLLATEAHCFFGILGSCNCKVDKATCENIISLASNLMLHCKSKTLDFIQSHSVVVERAASFLARAALAEEDGGAFDAPLLGAGAREQAVALLFELFAVGGRVEKRALRGAAPFLATGPAGEGFFTADAAPVRALGESVAHKAMSDPSLATCVDVRNLLQAIQLLIVSGPVADAGEKESAVISHEDVFGPGAKMRYANLTSWATTEDGQHCGLLLQVVSKALEFRLLRSAGELERDGFEDAFHAGGGYFIVVPLVQAPASLAEPALRCLAVLAQTSVDNATTIVRLSALHALLGMPCPEAKPMLSCVGDTLKTSPGARKQAAKLMSKLVETQIAMEVLKDAEEKWVQEIISLASNVRKDGKESLEAFHDMLQVLYILTALRPGALAHLIILYEDMMNTLVELAGAPEDDVTVRAKTIVQTLRKDKKCKKMLKPLMEAGPKPDLEDDLLGQNLTPWFHHV